MVTKDEVLNGLDMYHDKLKNEFGGVVVGRKSSTTDGAMWFTVDDDLYWSLYICINGARIEVAYGQLKNRK